MSVKFLHVRLLNESGRPLPKGGVTVAYRQDDEKIFEVSYAFCNPKDHYCKKIGRDISTGRLVSKKGACFIEADTKQELFESIKEELDVLLPAGSYI